MKVTIRVQEISEFLESTPSYLVNKYIDVTIEGDAILVEKYLQSIKQTNFADHWRIE